MKAPEALDKKLQRELGWRKKELLVVETQIQNMQETERLNTALRSGIVLLYAHWEGFVKQAASAYLEFIRTNIHEQNLRYQEINQALIALTLEHRLLEKWRKTEGKNWEIPGRIMNFFMRNLTDFAQLPKANQISMLSTWKMEWENFFEIMVLLGLDFAPYHSQEIRNLLNTRLFQNRNTVAHGERAFRDGLDKSQYLVIHSEMLVLMDSVSEQFYQAAMHNAYQDTSHSLISQFRLPTS